MEHFDFHKFYIGKAFNAHEFLGSHVTEGGMTFAPHAEKISIIGDFNDWKEIPMNRLPDRNFFECFILLPKRTCDTSTEYSTQTETLLTRGSSNRLNV